MAKVLFKENSAAGFSVAYAGLGAVALASVFAFFAIIFTPVTPVAHKGDITKAIGSTTEAAIIKQAEQNVAQQANQAGVTITEQKVAKVAYPNSNEADVYINLKTVELGPVKLKVTLHKGLYNVVNTTQE